MSLNIFDVLLFFNLLLVGLALFRSRPTALMIALNQAGTLRALGNIQSFGQPSSEPFLPKSIFAPPSLEVAWKIFAISTVILSVSLLVQPKKTGLPTQVFPPLPRWGGILLGLYLAGLTFSSQNLTSQSYANEGGSILGISLGGLNAFMFSLLLYEVVRRKLVGTWKPWLAFLVLATAMFLTNYSKGSTGLATGYGVAGAVMIWQHLGPRLGRKTLISAAMVAAFLLLAFVVRGVRQVFHEEGVSAVAALLTRSGEAESQDEHVRTAQGLEVAGNGTQYACHVLECIYLHDAGISRNWRSIYNPIIFTFEPSFLLRPFGITRPQDAPWELADYYNHGGGIFLLGDLYWNGGYACVLIMMALLAILAFYCDTRFARSPFWLMMCAQFAPNLLMGVGYGFAQVSRGAINGLLSIGIYRLLPAFRLRSMRNAPRPPLRRNPILEAGR